MLGRFSTYSPRSPRPVGFLLLKLNVAYLYQASFFSKSVGFVQGVVIVTGKRLRFIQLVLLLNFLISLFLGFLYHLLKEPTITKVFQKVHYTVKKARLIILNSVGFRSEFFAEKGRIYRVIRTWKLFYLLLVFVQGFVHCYLSTALEPLIFLFTSSASWQVLTPRKKKKRKGKRSLSNRYLLWRRTQKWHIYVALLVAWLFLLMKGFQMINIDRYLNPPTAIIWW